MRGNAQLGPLVVGTLGILALAVVLTFDSPSPGALAAPHEGIERFAGYAGCESCHAEGGLDQGCLGCHREISDELALGRGYHKALLGDGPPHCASCHPDHHGETFDLVGAVAWQGRDPQDFDHGHVPFDLKGKHDGLGCDACHGRAAPVTLPAYPDRPRAQTYLGLTQACRGCHENVHQAARYETCAECHDQDAFRPAPRFEHKPPLLRGHAGVACQGCHLLTEDRADFGPLKGKRCAECHDNPHRTPWSRDCEACHAADAAPWHDAAFAFDAREHETTGFPLQAPHAEVACDACHVPELEYGDRFPSPPREEQACATCHRDVHQGQFTAKHASCLDCHARTHFTPPAYTVRRHETYPLRGAHATAECQACHQIDAATGVRRFTETARTCAACHEDAHKGQLGAECAACHGEERWIPAAYDLAKHGSFPLQGAHRAVSCRGCHREDEALQARRFRETPRTCRACHADGHAGQFAAELKAKDCTACHRADAQTFAIAPYDHGERTGYALRGAHAGATCAQCHREERRKGVVQPVRRYRDTETACVACHVDVHRGQFREAGTVRCEKCHTSMDAWKPVPFDHARTRFALDKAHAQVSCERCHPAVAQPDGTRVTQYRPVGNQCRDCHGFDKR